MSMDQSEEAKEANQNWKYSNEQSEQNLALRCQIKGPAISRNASLTTPPSLKLRLWDLVGKRSSWEMRKAEIKELW